MLDRWIFVFSEPARAHPETPDENQPVMADIFIKIKEP